MRVISPVTKQPKTYKCYKILEKFQKWLGQSLLPRVRYKHKTLVISFSLNQHSSPGAATDTSRNHSDSHQVYYSEATPTQHNYSYNIVATDTEGLNTYDVIGNQQKPNTLDTSVTPTPVRDEASKGEDFYDAEEHMYAAVNKKKRCQRMV